MNIILKLNTGEKNYDYIEFLDIRNNLSLAFMEFEKDDFIVTKIITNSPTLEILKSISGLISDDAYLWTAQVEIDDSLSEMIILESDLEEVSL